MHGGWKWGTVVFAKCFGNLGRAVGRKQLAAVECSNLGPCQTRGRCSDWVRWCDLGMWRDWEPGWTGGYRVAAAPGVFQGRPTAHPHTVLLPSTHSAVCQPERVRAWRMSSTLFSCRVRTRRSAGLNEYALGGCRPCCSPAEYALGGLPA